VASPRHLRPKWALGFLRGYVRAYLRGNIKLRNVAGAVRLALSHDVSTTDVHAALADANLTWDAERDAVTVRSDRRISLRCPFCKSTATSQETTVKGASTTICWRCSSCRKTWPERRQPAA
jgi:hypothetical protein